MIYIKPKLEQCNKKAIDFISYICDDRRDLNLHKYKDETMIKIVRNGEEGKIYINEKLEPVLNEFLKDE